MRLGSIRRLAATLTLAGGAAGCADAQRSAPATPPRRPASPPAPAAAVPESGYGAREVARRRCTAEQRDFWQAFRPAALAGDVATLAPHVRLPLPLRGPLDGPPLRRVAQARLATEWPALLAIELEDVDIGEARAAGAATMRALLERHATPMDRWCTTDGQMNVGAFVFLRDDRARRWRLVEAFLPE